MNMYTEGDYKEYGEYLGFMWDDGATLAQLPHFKHEGRVIVNPYSYVPGNVDPATVFGETKMSHWKSECHEGM